MINVFQIANKFKKNHNDINRLIKKYVNDFACFGEIKTIEIKTKGRPKKGFVLNESQYMYLVLLFDNSKHVLKEKVNVIKEFSKARKELNGKTEVISENLQIEECELWEK